jgi:hypothetical protein
MNEIEAQIRQLSLRPPEDTLDQRVLVELAMMDRSSPQFDQSLPRRGATVVTAVWATLACVAGLIVFGGNPELPSGSTKPGRSSSMTATAGVEAGSGGEGQGTRNRDQTIPSNAADEPWSRTSQNAEFELASARLLADEWEIQSGKVFPTALHLKDLRFFECRRCHVALSSPWHLSVPHDLTVTACADCHKTGS